MEEQTSMLPRLLDMIKTIRIATGSTAEETDRELQSIFADFQTSDVRNDETNDCTVRMRKAMVTFHVLENCQDQIVAVLGTSTTPLTNIAIAETFKELKTGHHSVMDELQQIIVGLVSTEEQQASEMSALKAVVWQQNIDKQEVAQQLLDDRKQSDVEIYELLTQLQGAQQKLGEAHRFITKYSASTSTSASALAGAGAGAVDPPTVPPSASTTTTTATTTARTPPSTFAGRRDSAGGPNKNTHKTRQRSASPPKSLRSLVPRPAAPVDDAQVASARIMAAGMSMNNVGSSVRNDKPDDPNGTAAVVKEQPPSSPSPSQPFPTDVSMVSLRDASHSHSFGTDFDKAWLFQFRAEVQQTLDVSSLELQDLSMLSAASSASCRPGGTRGGGGMMFAKDCLAVVRRLYDFHKDSQPAVRARIACACSLEQRLYLMMERRYGLRALAVQQASLFLQAMEVYTEGCGGLSDLDSTPRQQQQQLQVLSSSSSSASVASAAFSSATTTASGAARDLNELSVFLAAFRNEVEDDFFPRTQTALVQAVRDLVLVAQRQTQAQAQAQKQRARPRTNTTSRVSGDAATATSEPSDDLALSVREWRDHVLRFLYHDDDSRRVVAVLKQHSRSVDLTDATPTLSSSSSPSAATAALPLYAKHLLDASAIPQPPRPVSSCGSPAVRSHSPGKLAWERKTQQLAESEGALVAYSDVLRVVLDYQLLQHRAFLSSVHRAFVACDEDGDGLLGAAELIRCFDLLLQSSSAEGASSSLQHTVDKAADAALVDAAHNNNNNNNNTNNPDRCPDSPLHRRQQYVKQRAQLHARQKQAAVVAAKNRLREEFVKVVSLVVPIDEHARVNFTTVCKCVTRLFT